MSIENGSRIEGCKKARSKAPDRLNPGQHAAGGAGNAAEAKRQRKKLSFGRKTQSGGIIQIFHEKLARARRQSIKRIRIGRFDLDSSRKNQNPRRQGKNLIGKIF